MTSLPPPTAGQPDPNESFRQPTPQPAMPSPSGDMPPAGAPSPFGAAPAAKPRTGPRLLQAFGLVAAVLGVIGIVIGLTGSSAPPIVPRMSEDVATDHDSTFEIQDVQLTKGTTYTVALADEAPSDAVVEVAAGSDGSGAAVTVTALSDATMITASFYGQDDKDYTPIASFTAPDDGIYLIDITTSRAKYATYQDEVGLFQYDPNGPAPGTLLGMSMGLWVGIVLLVVGAGLFFAGWRLQRSRTSR